MTEKRLVLIRHAKAKQGERDIERPLARRGRDDARVIGEWLDRNAVPDLAIVSPAVRTRETWQCALAALSTSSAAEPLMVVDDRIYDNTVADLVDAVRSCDETPATLALVGHNPSMQAMAARAERATDEGMEALLGFPTSTVALLAVEGPWRAFDPRHARLLAVEVCRGEFGR